MSYFNYKSFRLFFREQGNGPLLIILPGNTASSVWHQGELDCFSRRYHVAVLDFLGTGESDRLESWPDDWWYEGACQAKALVDHLGEKRCIVMGTSGGAAAALLMAIHFPQYVSAVVADSCVEKFAPQSLREEVESRHQLLSEQKSFWEKAHGQDWKGVVDADSRLLLRLADKGGDCIGGRLGEIQCPVLLTASLQDSLLPDAAQQICRMGQQIPDSRIFLNNAGDHPLMWSRPNDFRQVSEWFMSRPAF